MPIGNATASVEDNSSDDEPILKIKFAKTSEGCCRHGQ